MTPNLVKLSEYYDDIIYQLCQRIGCNGLSIDYRLAPEHPFPAGLNDCHAVVSELCNNG